MSTGHLSVSAQTLSSLRLHRIAASLLDLKRLMPNDAGWDSMTCMNSSSRRDVVQRSAWTVGHI